MSDDEFEGELDIAEGAAPSADGAPRFRCRGCGHRSNIYWMGPCPMCGIRFNVVGKEKKHSDKMRVTMSAAAAGQIKPMEYHATGIPEVDLILNGGVVYGKVVLWGGQKGNGKTRLCLQVAGAFARKHRRAYFVSGEDSLESVVQFGQQLEIQNDNLEIYGNPDGIDPMTVTDYLKANSDIKLLICDSLQVCAFEDKKAKPGTDVQIESTINHFSYWAKTHRIAVILISQLVKDDDYRASESALHNVDVLARFDPMPDIDENLRELWIDGKSRQGPTSVKAYMEMSPEGKLVKPSPRLLKKVSKLEIVS